MGHFENFVKGCGSIFRETLGDAVGIRFPFPIVLRKVKCFAVLALKSEGEGAAFYLQLGSCLLTVDRVRLPVLRQFEDDGSGCRHNERIGLHVIRHVAEYLGATGLHGGGHGIGKGGAASKVCLSIGSYSRCSVGRSIRLLVFCCAAAGHRLRCIVDDLSADILCCQLTIGCIHEILRDILRHLTCKRVGIFCICAVLSCHVGITGDRDQRKLALIPACLLQLACALNSCHQVQGDIRADVLAVLVILPDLRVGDCLGLVHAAVPEACRDLQILIIFAGSPRHCSRISRIQRTFAGRISAFVWQTLRAGILIPCSFFLIVQREAIEGYGVVVEIAAACTQCKSIILFSCSGFSVDHG